MMNKFFQKLSCLIYVYVGDICMTLKVCEDGYLDSGQIDRMIVSLNQNYKTFLSFIVLI